MASYDGMYSDLSTRGTTNQILTQVIEIQNQVLLSEDNVEALAVQASNSAAAAANSEVVSANAAATSTAAATSASSSASSANDSALTATQAAADAVTNSAAALIIANDADDKADAAVATANGIAGTANTALANSVAAVSTANTASANADAAVITANGIAGTANDALANSVTATNTANTANANASAAVATANAAQPGDATLTALAALVTAANKIIYSTGVDTFSQTDLTAFARTLLDDASASSMKSTLGVLEVGSAFIEGLVPLWVSATSIQINPGSAYIPSLGRVITATGALVLSGLTLTAATWYYLYLYDNAGTAAIELVTTSPTAPYAGFARTKSGGGGDSRRFLGAFRAQVSNVLRTFVWAEDYVNYTDSAVLYPILSNGTATSATVVSGASAIPPSTRRALMQVYSAIGNSFNIGIAFDAQLLSVAASTRVLSPVISTESQTFVYSHVGTVTGGTTLDIRGYGSER